MISIGERLDSHYLVHSVLGSGGFGSVFLAEDEGIPGRHVAIKVLNRTEEGADSMLWREMEALARFNHPHIVGFLHHFNYERHPCLVMEHCSGGSLLDVLKDSGPISEEQALSWGVTLCDTLEFVHQNGIVHHDIKPSNILLADNGDLKVGDFGIVNSRIGTRIYMPPEMLLGEVRDGLDARVDIYALGLTLLELLTGKNPFIDLDQATALQARIAHEFIPQSLPQWIQELLLTATHPTAELRFQNMKDFSEAIHARHVSYIFNRKRIEAETVARKALALLEKRKRKAAQDLAVHALDIHKDSVTALLVAGRCRLRIHQIHDAREYFNRALKISPRAAVQRDLAHIAVETGQYPLAISLLTDHLRRKASDYESYNLLIKCFYLTDRFEAAANLARILIDEKVRHACFRSNELICRILIGSCDLDEIEQLSSIEQENPFIRHALSIASEQPRSWGGKIPLKAKLLFQEFEFGPERRIKSRNHIACEFPEKQRYESDETIISIGSSDANDIVLSDPSVSRRHCAVVNIADAVWLYDLGSTVGTTIDGRNVTGRNFVHGVHDITIGRVKIRLASNRDLLI